MGDAMKFIFCEGKDDVAVLRGLTSHLKLEIQVEEFGGKSKLANFLRTLPKRPEFAYGSQSHRQWQLFVMLIQMRLPHLRVFVIH